MLVPSSEDRGQRKKGKVGTKIECEEKKKKRKREEGEGKKKTTKLLFLMN